jgi:hypothetical protein
MCPHESYGFGAIPEEHPIEEALGVSFCPASRAEVSNQEPGCFVPRKTRTDFEGWDCCQQEGGGFGGPKQGKAVAAGSVEKVAKTRAVWRHGVHRQEQHHTSGPPVHSGRDLQRLWTMGMNSLSSDLHVWEGVN